VAEVKAIQPTFLGSLARELGILSQLALGYPLQFLVMHPAAYRKPGLLAHFGVSQDRLHIPAAAGKATGAVQVQRIALYGLSFDVNGGHSAWCD